LTFKKPLKKKEKRKKENKKKRKKEKNIKRKKHKKKKENMLKRKTKNPIYEVSLFKYNGIDQLLINSNSIRGIDISL
jgi:hypothetical protein